MIRAHASELTAHAYRHVPAYSANAGIPATMNALCAMDVCAAEWTASARTANVYVADVTIPAMTIVPYAEDAYVPGSDAHALTVRAHAVPVYPSAGTVRNVMRTHAVAS